MKKSEKKILKGKERNTWKIEKKKRHVKEKWHYVINVKKRIDIKKRKDKSIISYTDKMTYDKNKRIWTYGKKEKWLAKEKRKKELCG